MASRSLVAAAAAAVDGGKLEEVDDLGAGHKRGTGGGAT